MDADPIDPSTPPTTRTRRRTRTWWGLTVTAVLVGGILAGCASADTPQYGAPEAPSMAEGEGGGAASAAPVPSGVTVLEIATTEEDPLAFTEDRLAAPPAAEVLTRYLNDSAVPHNIAFFEGGDATAPRLAATEVETGPGNLQTVTFTTPSDPGDYFFHCDVHPEQMQGTLRIEG